MAEKLSITIALEGGQAIERQLEGIGKAGQKAFDDISAAAAKAGGFKNLKPEEVTGKLKELGVTGEDAFNKITDAVKSATRMERLVGIVQSLETGFAGVATAAAGLVRALGPIGLVAGTIGTAMVASMASAAEAINKFDAAAIKAGLSIEKFDRLRQGFESAGLSTKQVEGGMNAIAAAIEKAAVDEVAKDFKTLSDNMARGFGVLGTAEWQRLSEAMQGGGKAAADAKKAIIDLGGTIADTGIKSLPEFIQKFKGDAPAAVNAFIEQLRALPDSAARSSQAMAGLSDAGIALVQGFRAGIVPLDVFRQQLGTMTPEMANAATAVEAASNRMATAWKRLQTTIGGKLLTESDVAQITAVLNGINALLSAKTWEAWGAAAQQAFIAIFAPIGELVVKLGELGATLGSQIWEGWGIAGAAAVNAISTALDALWEKLKGIGGAIAGAFSGGGGGGPEAGSIPGNARGGLLGGRGSGTSDSNLAWVSRGEHIMPAAAVKQPGVLALLEALRRSGGNLRGVLDGMGRFAAGGTVPRFAEGGLVGGIGHLGTVDLRTDHGTVRLMASGSAVEQLSRLAITKRITSTGRKPGFVGG